MSGVLTGFVVVAAVVAVGYALGRTGALGPGAQTVVSRLVFFVGTPALLVRTLAGTDPAELLSAQVGVTAAGVAACALLWGLLARWWLRLGARELVVGALGSSYVNAVNIGLPVAAYVLGDLTAVLPALLLQLVVLTPVALAVLDVLQQRPAGAPAGRGARARRLLAPLANPVLLASAAGLALTLTGTSLPTALDRPLELLAGLSVPGALLAFGMSLHGRVATGLARRDVLLATGLKALVQPAVTWAAARWGFGLDAAAVHAATVVAALPTAQNVFTFAVRYDAGRELARDTVLLTTVLCVPVVLLVGVLVPPG
ncbi:AEC family transporter [Kineococcus indalonis]|uniref:AEC family transporter n=1 Tax=Kineococcus indalonis TaxID=2696566 RepID=UPI001412030A|nr:AEC family transporter [Kineococcus indalonis]NAZ87202.1 AEC family transporter [Kineococcus indalonis]